MKQQHIERLGKEPIPKVLTKLATPAAFGLLVMASYNIVNAIFVERAVGMVGVSAVSIAFPVQLIIMAVAGAIGIGGASLISRLLGANKIEEANKVFGNIITLLLIVSVLGVVLGLKYLTPILYLFGSSESILPYAQEYLGIILYGTFFFAVGFCMNNIVRSEGNARIAMYTMLISAILNIIFTPLFIFGFDMGIKGSALSAVVAQGITTVYLIHYYAAGKSSLSFYAPYLRPKLAIIKQILAIGSSAFVQQAAGSIMFVFANHMLIIYGGDIAVGVFGIIHRIIMLSFMPVIGIVQGLLPIVGYNYGAKQHHRVSESISLAIKASTVIVAVCFVIIMAFPKPILLVFTSDSTAIKIGQTALRIMFALSLTVGIQSVTGAVFQALGMAKAAFILSTSRQILFLIPLILILPLKFKLEGIWLAFPVADLLSFLLALVFIYSYKSIFFPVKKTATMAQSTSE
ncbi:MATE family efflux transporter [Desulfofalx alkaliphila]|uniref:MATE family efflux transporter n=1 Tax=Desulfofalx alkaliphila TaxID=105483 RepID=UPI0004E24A6E|nr:MATE family efflux transporter [Desulfofalx alkaliphila]